MQFNGNATISSNTADSSDNAQIIISGGGASGDTRGASVHIAGNESGNGGLLQLRAGDGSVGGIRLYTGGSERMRITSGGDIQINEALTIQDTSQGATSRGLKAFGGNDAGIIYMFRPDGGGTNVFRFYTGTTLVGSINTTNTNTSFNETSDYRLKEDLQDFAGLDMVSKIPVYDFKWKIDESRSYGVMAHELQEVLPQAVSGEKDAEEMQGVDYSKIVPLLVKSIQELKAEVDKLKQECKCKN